MIQQRFLFTTYRAKTKADDKWVVGGFATSNQRGYILTDDSLEVHEINTETLGMAFEFNDVEGNHIFTDDIVDILLEGEEKGGDWYHTHGRIIILTDQEGEYRFSHGHETPKKGCGRPPKRFWKNAKYKVVGNIYDNPEFLHKTK